MIGAFILGMTSLKHPGSTTRQEFKQSSRGLFLPDNFSPGVADRPA
jgi:hypothetical protein